MFDHKPDRGRRCATRLTGDDPDPVVDQVLDPPAKLRHVVHHRRHTLACPCCHAETTAAPVPEAASGFGPRLTAVAAYRTGVGRLGKRAVRASYADVCDPPVSPGAVSRLEATVSRALEPIHAEAHERAKSLDANVDGTGGPEGNAKAWLRVAVAKLLTVFPIRPNRNRAAFDDPVGPAPGALTTDRFPVHTHLRGRRRQVCRAHLRRDFQAMIDRKNDGSKSGEELPAHADILFVHWPKVRDGTRSRRWFERTQAGGCGPRSASCRNAGRRAGAPRRRRRAARSWRWRRACGRSPGGTGEQGQTAGEVAGVEASLWTFAGRDGVEPTNNAAERAVRHAVCRRETSDGTDGARGSRFAERMLTVVASCRQQGRGILEFLTQAVRGAKPSLLPQGA